MTQPADDFAQSVQNTRWRDKHFVFVIGQLERIGGAERQALTLAASIRATTGAAVSVLGWGARGGALAEELEALDIQCFSFPLVWFNRSRMERLKSLKKLVQFVNREIKPDYFLPYIGENCKVIGLIWRFTSARYTWWNQRDEGRGISGTTFEKWLVRNLPGVVSNSWEGRDFLVRVLGAPFDRVKVINNAVVPRELPEYGGWRDRLGIGERDQLIVMSANLTRFKDHETLLRAFALLGPTRRGGTYHLALAGRAGTTASHLEQLTHDLSLSERVHFLGYVAGVNSLVAEADLMAHSSVTEGCPNAVLEAMAQELCVVGTDISGMRQALGDERADNFLAPAHDAQALADLMKRYLDDDEARSTEGRLNRARIEQEFTIEKLTSAVLDEIASRC